MEDKSENSTIEAWLSQHGLLRLKDLFLQHAIDIDVLTELTSPDLAEMGVPLGDRKRVLKAIGHAPQPDTQAPRGPAPQVSPAANALAERRQITVLFCDLVGSTQLTTSVDPEESRSVIRKYREVVGAEIEKLGGHIAQYLGDGVLAYFGWPKALEGAAHRAVSAGLSAIDAVAKQADLQRYKLHVRLSAATGMAVVGSGSDGSQTEDNTAVGEVVNIAARLQNFAAPSSMVIAQSTRALVASQFHVSSLGEKELKGLEGRFPVFRVEASAIPQRPSALKTTALLGRESEMQLVRNRWNMTRHGEGQVVSITGEPGIGKSFMTEKLIGEIVSDGTVHLRFDCSQFQQNTSLHPFIEELRVLTDIRESDEAIVRVQKLESFTQRFGAERALHMPSLLRLLSLSSPAWPEPEDTTPMVRKAGVFLALTSMLMSRINNGASLIVLEDAHWADATTLEYLEQLAMVCRGLPVMLLINARPDFRPQWQNAGNFTPIALQRLPRQEVENLVSTVSAGYALPPSVMDSIIKRSDGIPLFIEELTKAVLEATSHNASTAGDIPLSLRDTLMTRLDRHPEARDLAQLAACVGRECDHELLACLSGKSEQQLEDALAKLSQAEILFRNGFAPQVIYRFKHALVQEAAVDTLLKSKRRDVHAAIAAFLESRRPDFAAAQPELLAHHFTQAQDYVAAIRYRQKAGHRAVAASGNIEAISEFSLALDLLQLVAPSQERDVLEVDTLIAQAVPATLTMGYAAPEVEAIYRRALDASTRLPQTAQSFAVTYGLWRFYLLRGDYTNAKQLSEQLLHIAAGRQEPAMNVTSNRAAGAVRFYMAGFRESLVYLERTASIVPDEALRKAILTYDVVDPWVVNTAYSGMGLWIHGRPALAIETSERALHLAREVNHPFTLALALCFAQWTYQFQRNRERVADLSNEALAISHKYGFTFWKGWAEMMLAWAESEGDAQNCRHRMKSALQLWQSTGSQLGLSYFQCLLAEQSVGAEADVMFGAAEKFSISREELFWLPEIHRTRGQHALREDFDDAISQAEASFIKAHAVAENLEANGLALRAALDLFNLQGRSLDQHLALDMLKRSVAKFGREDSFEDLQSARDIVRH